MTPRNPAAWIAGMMTVVALAAVNPWGWDRFGPIRWMLVPTLVLAAAAVTFHQIPAGVGRDRERATAERISSGLWAGILMLGAGAAVAGVDSLHAWIGTPDRHLGWLTWVLFALSFWVGGRLVASSDQAVPMLARATTVGIALCGVYTAFEWADLAVPVSFADGRLGGPFGQPAYLGAAAALALPVAAGLALDNNQTSRWRIIGAIGTAGGLVALLTSQTRAAWVGVAVALLMIAVRHGAAIRRATRRQLSAVVGLVAAAAVLALATPLGGRAVSLFDPSGVIQGRSDEWRVALRAIGDKPILGHGPEGYRVVFGHHVDTDYVLAHGRDTITDRAHSAPLDVAVTLGIPAALMYCGLVLVLGIAAWRSLSDGDPVRAGLGAAVIAYSVQQLFLFPLAEVDPVFWLLAGAVLAPGHALESMGAPAGGPTGGSLAANRLGFGAVVAGGLCAGLALVVGIAGAVEMIADQRVRAAVDSGHPPTAHQHAESAAKTRPDSIRYHFIAARLAEDDTQALAHIRRGLERSPHDPALREEEATLLLDVARGAPAGPARTEQLAMATMALLELTDLDPHHPLHNRRLGVAHALSGEFDLARQSFVRAATLDPENPAIQRDLEELDRLIAEAEQ